MTEPAIPASEAPAYIVDTAMAIEDATKDTLSVGPQGGRPWKLSADVVIDLLSELRHGTSLKDACAIADITPETLSRWMQRGEDEEPTSPFGQLNRAVKRARAEARARWVRNVAAAAEKPQFWAAGMTLLERSDPENWGRKDADKVINVNVGVALGVQVSDEQRRQLVPRVDVSVLSPVPETASALSLPAPVAVSDAQAEAKATPIGGVSPPDVA